MHQICPQMPDSKRKRLAEAAQKYPLAAQAFESGITEQIIFDRKYQEIGQLYLSAVGGSNPMNVRAILDMFSEYKPVAEAVASRFTHEVVEGSFACDVAEANKDVVMRPICEDTFGTTTANSVKIGPYQQTISAEGDVNLIPSAASISDGGAATWTATKEEQTIVIFGYAETYADDAVISRIQETITDRVGDRKPLEVYLQQQLGDMKVIKRNSALWVEDTNTLDINATAIKAGKTGMYPIGVDFCINSQVTAIAP